MLDPALDTRLTSQRQGLSLIGHQVHDTQHALLFLFCLLKGRSELCQEMLCVLPAFFRAFY
jgi:hypothetical protein